MPDNEISEIIVRVRSARHVSWVSDTCCVYDEGDGVTLTAWAEDGSRLCSVRMPRAEALEAAHAFLSCVRALDRAPRPEETPGAAQPAPRQGS